MNDIALMALDSIRVTAVKHSRRKKYLGGFID